MPYRLADSTRLAFAAGAEAFVPEGEAAGLEVVGDAVGAGVLVCVVLVGAAWGFGVVAATLVAGLAVGAGVGTAVKVIVVEPCLASV